MAVSYPTHHGVLLAAGLAALASCRGASRQSPPDQAQQRQAQPTAEEQQRYGEERAKRKRERGFKPKLRRPSAADLAVINRETAREAVKEQAARRAGVAARAVAGESWVSLGPTNALRQFNGGAYDAADSGRLNDIVVDPRDPNVMYVASSGGGVWKSFDALAPSGPTWAPTTDAQFNLAVGALAMDPTAPDTLYLGAGDAFDGAGNTVQRTSDGAVTWGQPVVLEGTYPAPNGQPALVSSIRAMKARGDVVIAGTDGGLFVSRNRGASFSLVDLPNRNGKILLESIWSVVDLGGAGWAVSGVSSCDVGLNPAPLSGGLLPSAACPEGNLGYVWSSLDGTTWAVATLPGNFGRITLDASGTNSPATVAIYGMAGAVDNQSTAMLLRSTDKGRTFTSAMGTLTNPCPDCSNLDVGGGQTYYNQSVIGDPANPANVIIGGVLCGFRTLNGTAGTPSWELVSHWLPIYSGGFTSRGALPYLHADWHSGTATVVNGVTRAYVGNDGGVFASSAAFQPGAGENVRWTLLNRGLVTHLFYSVASGDPATQNPFVLYAGAQDNGTRFRVTPNQPSVFNQVIGGDGIGATVHSTTTGSTYWGSVQYSRLYCLSTSDCTVGGSWRTLDPVLPATQEEEAKRWERYRDANPNDAEPFFIHYANVESDTTGPSVLTHSVGRVFVVTRNGGNLTWTPISQDLTGSNTGFGNVAASRTQPGIYGAVGTVSAAPFFTSTAGNTLTTWQVTQPVRPNGTADRLTGPSSMDFQPGNTNGQIFIASFTGTLNDAARTPPPDDRGRLYRTTDRGQTWTSIVGTGASRLPNVPVYVAKYDPVDPQTIYAGTEIGVYVTTDGGASWRRMGVGLPVVQVRDIYVAKNQEFIRVATWGRGLWEIYPSATANRGTPGNGDYDRNQIIDWLDLAAVASRQGATPATTTQPLYHWNVDVSDGPVNPPTQIIDAHDLTNVLGKLGRTP